MAFFRRLLILAHRYLGIALGAFFIMWFASGIGILFTKGMPRLTPEMRLERLSPIDISRVRLTPAEAAKAGLYEDPPPSRISLVTLLGRPAYRLGAERDGITVFADNGEQLTEIGKSEAVQIAAQFMRAPASQLGYALQTSADVWTLGVRRQLPLQIGRAHV